MNLTKRRDAAFPSGQARALTSFTVRDVPGHPGLVTVRQGTTFPATDAVVRKAPSLFVDSGTPEQPIGRQAAHTLLPNETRIPNGIVYQRERPVEPEPDAA